LNLWLAISLAGVLLLIVTLGYAAIRWRRAPKVYRAMNWVVSVSAVAGVLLTLSFEHWIVPSLWPASSKGEGSSLEHLGDLIRGTCPPAGVPANQVGKEMILADEHHSGEANWISNQEQAEFCKKVDPGPDTQLCTATFMARHALGLDLDLGDHRSLIPCEEVAEFCDNGALEKASSLCKMAYQSRNAKLGSGK